MKKKSRTVFCSDISPFLWPDPLRRAFPALLGVCALCVPDTLLAAPDSYLDEVVVTATQRAQSVREVPAAASVILREQMDTQGAENVLDSLRDTPGCGHDRTRGWRAQDRITARHGGPSSVCAGNPGRKAKEG
ncbi:TonB-dependent receptor plug domain-containing protein [Thiorhodospira sibirica]|uniref:TonB-dependent receptor plug domain-containing protein n=1 Tax=Thiorhodospira sibirica TaxID=154347 RepID=UPI0002DB83F5|nr:TonB-dependent receptor plug domain-containing protein [Thiorhodospira sibirica]